MRVALATLFALALIGTTASAATVLPSAPMSNACYKVAGAGANGLPGCQSVDTSHGLPTSPAGLSTLATAQVSVAATATVIAAARTGRSQVTVTNLGTTDVFLGGSGVTTTTGILLTGTKGASVTLTFAGALYGIVATGTQSVSVAETF